MHAGDGLSCSSQEQLIRGGITRVAVIWLAQILSVKLLPWPVVSGFV